MRAIFAALAALSLTSALLADDQILVEDVPQGQKVEIHKKTFSFLAFPSTQTKDPALPTPVDPSIPPTLRPGVLYVVPSEEKFTLKAYPPGLVTIRGATSPLNIYGVFWDDDGEDERTYSQPFLYIVKAVPGKTGDIYLVHTPSVDRGDDTITSMLIRIGVAPQPPPDKPDVTPDVKPDVKPDVPVVPAPVVDTFKTLIQQITERHKDKFTPVTRTKVASSFREAAVKIEAGTVTDPGQELTKVTADLITEKIGLNEFFPLVKWRDDVTSALRTQGYTTIKEHTKPWNTIADVLEGK